MRPLRQVDIERLCICKVVPFALSTSVAGLRCVEMDARLRFIIHQHGKAVAQIRVAVRIAHHDRIITGLFHRDLIFGIFAHRIHHGDAAQALKIVVVEALDRHIAADHGFALHDGLAFRRDRVVRVELRRHFNLVVLSIRHQALRQLLRRQLFRQLLCDGRLCDIVCAAHTLLARIFDGITDIDVIVARFHHIGGFVSGFSDVVIARHIGNCEGHFQRFGLARLEQVRLIERCQLFSGLAHLGFALACLRRAEIHLHDLFAGHVAGVCHGCRNIGGACEGVATKVYGDLRNFEIRVRQAVAKRIIDLLVIRVKGLKIPVAHIDVFRVIYIAGRFVERLRARVILIRFGPRINQFAGGVHVAHKDIGGSKSALHTGLPTYQHSIHARDVVDPAGICHSANVQHNDDLVKFCRHAGNEFFFGIAEVVVALGRRTVAAFRGIPADCHNRRVRCCRCCVHHFVRDVDLRIIFNSVRRHLLSVEVNQRLIQGNLPFLLFDLHPLQDIAGVVHIRCTGTAAAARVVNHSTAEHRYRRALLHWQSFVPIFQQDHTVSSNLPGKLNISLGRFCASGNAHSRDRRCNHCSRKNCRKDPFAYAFSSTHFLTSISF